MRSTKVSISSVARLSKLNRRLMSDEMTFAECHCLSSCFVTPRQSCNRELPIPYWCGISLSRTCKSTFFHPPLLISVDKTIHRIDTVNCPIFDWCAGVVFELEFLIVEELDSSIMYSSILSHRIQFTELEFLGQLFDNLTIWRQLKRMSGWRNIQMGY